MAYEIANRHRMIALHGSERESRRACEFWLERQFGWSKPKPAEKRTDREVPVSVMAVPMPMTIMEWQAAAIANTEALDALAERQVHRLEAPPCYRGWGRRLRNAVDIFGDLLNGVQEVASSVANQSEDGQRRSNHLAAPITRKAHG